MRGGAIMEDLNNNSRYLYLYGLIPSNEFIQEEAPLFNGIDQSPCFFTQYKHITAVVCAVNSEDFSQEQLEYKIKDPKWLEEKALHHHECINLLARYYTILPISFCTIFEHTDRLQQMLSAHYDPLSQKLDTLYQKQEWNVKFYYDSESMKSFISQHNPTVLAFQKELELMPKGKQFIMKKKLSQIVQAEVEKEQNNKISELTKELKGCSTDILVRKNWGKEISQRKEDMVLNCDFLVEINCVDKFLKRINEFEKASSSQGWILQVTGPWPPYHFSKMSKEVL